MGLLENSKYRNRSILHGIIKTIQENPENPKWIECPDCKVEWNKLTKAGICFNCSKNKGDLNAKS